LWARLLPAWFWPLVIALSFLLPAATLVIAIDDQFFKALNPAYVPHFIGAMGGAYFVLWGFFLLIAGARQLVLRVGEGWPGFVQLPLELGLSTYLAWVLCALLGYTLYQFHQELHLDVDVDFDTHREAGGAEKIAAAGSAQAAIHGAAPRTALERKVDDLEKAGRIDEAIAEVHDQMRYDRLDPDLNTRLHALHLELGDHNATLVQGQTWLRGLVKAQRMREALAALRALRSMDARFLPDDADTTAALADRAMDERSYELAAVLVNGFNRRFPGHAQAAAMFFIGGRILAEHWQDHARGVQMMRGIVTHYGSDPVALKAARCLAQLEGKTPRRQG
jgi:hypothetical protein